MNNNQQMISLLGITLVLAAFWEGNSTWIKGVLFTPDYNASNSGSNSGNSASGNSAITTQGGLIGDMKKALGVGVPSLTGSTEASTAKGDVAFFGVAVKGIWNWITGK